MGYTDYKLTFGRPSKFVIERSCNDEWLFGTIKITKDDKYVLTLDEYDAQRLGRALLHITEE